MIDSYMLPWISKLSNKTNNINSRNLVSLTVSNLNVSDPFGNFPKILFYHLVEGVSILLWIFKFAFFYLKEKKMAKKQPYTKRYNFKTIEDFQINFRCEIFKLVSTLCWNLQNCIFLTHWEITRRRALRLGRAGPGWLSLFITDSKFYGFVL